MMLIAGLVLLALGLVCGALLLLIPLGAVAGSTNLVLWVLFPTFAIAGYLMAASAAANRGSAFLTAKPSCAPCRSARCAVAGARIGVTLTSCSGRNWQASRTPGGRFIRSSTLSSKLAKAVFEALWSGEGASADAIIEARGLKQVSDVGAIEAIVDKVLAANAAQVEDYRASDEAKRKKKLGFFVGQIMKESQGKANPQQVNDLLLRKLGG